MVFLETWYHQKDCHFCGVQICYLDGRWHESNGSIHNCRKRVHWERVTTCKEEGCNVKLPPGQHYCDLHLAMRKPTWKRAAVEHEKTHEGQKSLEEWYQ